MKNLTFPKRTTAIRVYRAASERLAPLRSDEDSLPTHIAVPEPASQASPVFGAVLSVISVVLLSFILRLAVPEEDDSVDLAVLITAIGFAQVWLIFILLKSIRK